MDNDLLQCGVGCGNLWQRGLADHFSGSKQLLEDAMAIVKSEAQQEPKETKKRKKQLEYFRIC